MIRTWGTYYSRVVDERNVDFKKVVFSSFPDTKVTIYGLTQHYDEESLRKKVTDCNKVIKTFRNENWWSFFKYPKID